MADSSSPGALRETLSDVKITAVDIINNWILAGVGGNLEVYSLEDYRLLARHRALYGAAIHGIQRGPSQSLLLWGGKHWCIVKLQPSLTSKMDFAVSEQVAVDWIWDCFWPEDSILLQLTAHNQVLEQVLEPFGSVPKARICQEKCILYSGILLPGDLVLAGTVFSELLIWNSAEGRILHRLRGHEGVIFSVSYNTGLNVITTTSDDRSSRIWKVKFQSERNDPTRASNWASASISCDTVLRGHGSRIFRNHWSNQHLLTGGEDSKLIIWPSLDKTTPTCDPIHIKAHSGSPVWALAPDTDRGLVFTGGGDGSLRAWSMQTNSQTRALQATANVEPKDHAIAVKFSNWNSILTLTVGGNLYEKRLENGQTSLILSEDSLRNYGIIEILQCDTILLGNLVGDLIFLRRNENCEYNITSKRIYGGKVFSLHTINNETILSCGSDGNLRLVPKDGDEVSLTLPKQGDQRWVSCAAITMSGTTLALGDRCGSLHIYDLTDTKSKEPKQTLTKLHGRHGVGDVTFVDETRLKTTGRDGFIKNLRTNKNGKWNQYSCEQLPMKWLERLVKFRGEDLILGFQSTDFLIYSLSEQRPVISINCGGSHRSWDFSISSDGSARLVFIKDKEVFLSDIPLQNVYKSDLKNPFHAREVSLVHHFCLKGNDYLVTAGEDVVVKIHRVNSSATERKTVLSLKSHISSVKAVRTLSLDENTVLMASAGARAQMILWKIQVDDEPDSVTVTELTSHLLKGNDRKRKKTWKYSEIVFDTETRYMDLEIIQGREKGEIRVVTACSDGILLTWSVSNDLKKIEQISESISIDHCFLRLSQNKGQIISGSTDGIIRHWNFSDAGELSLIREYRTHQSGINALHVSEDLVLTGSDSGAIGINDIRIPKKHTCQITGIHKIGSNVVTASVDQRLSVWTLDGDKITLSNQIYSDVADIQDMTVWSCESQYFLAVVGEGLGIYQLKL